MGTPRWVPPPPIHVSNNNKEMKRYGTYMTATDLEELYGKAITPQELGRFLNLDPRTVIKYADRWGGIEVSPGKIRFFEKPIRRYIDASFRDETRQAPMGWRSHGKRKKEDKTLSRCKQGQPTGSSLVGGRNPKATGDIPDVHGIFDLA